MNWFDEAAETMSSVERYAFVIIGVGIWITLLVLFSLRISRDDKKSVIKTTTPPQIENRNGVNIISSGGSSFMSIISSVNTVALIVLILHILCGILVVPEVFMMNSSIWLSWFVIATAVTATFLNTTLVNGGGQKAINISTVFLQCFSISLMTAYIFSQIRK